MLVSVVTPSFNQAEFIEDTILSVLGQDHPYIEFLVVDGASTDGTVDLLKRYTGRIEWISEKDNGQSDAINKGLSYTKGDIVTWLCSDDSYLPGTIQRIVEEFSRHPEADVIYGDVNYTDVQNNPRMRFRARPFELANALTTSENPVAQAGSFMRRQAWERAGGVRNSLKYLMDWDLWLRMGLIGCHFHYIPEVLANARLQPMSKTVSGGTGVADALIRIINDLYSNKATMQPELWSMHRQALSSAHFRGCGGILSGAPDERGVTGLWHGVPFVSPQPISALCQHLSPHYVRDQTCAEIT